MVGWNDIGQPFHPGITLRRANHAILVVDAIHHASLPRIVLDEHFDLTPDCIRQIEASASLHVHTERGEESHGESNRLGIEVPIERNPSEILCTSLGVLHDGALDRIVGRSTILRRSLTDVGDVDEVPRGFHDLPTEQITVTELDHWHCCCPCVVVALYPSDMLEFRGPTIRTHLLDGGSNPCIVQSLLPEHDLTGKWECSTSEVIAGVCSQQRIISTRALDESLLNVEMIHFTTVRWNLRSDLLPCGDDLS